MGTEESTSTKRDNDKDSQKFLFGIIAFVIIFTVATVFVLNLAKSDNNSKYEAQKSSVSASSSISSDTSEKNSSSSSYSSSSKSDTSSNSSSSKSYSSKSSSSDNEYPDAGVYSDDDAVYASDGKGNTYAEDSDGNSYYFSKDGSSVAVDKKGNAIADTNGDGKTDLQSTDGGKTWKDAD